MNSLGKCYQFEKGNCTYGDRCRFRHDDGNSNNQQERSASGDDDRGNFRDRQAPVDRGNLQRDDPQEDGLEAPQEDRQEAPQEDREGF